MSPVITSAKGDDKNSAALAMSSALRSFLRGKRRKFERKKKRDTLQKYVPETATALSGLL